MTATTRAKPTTREIAFSILSIGMGIWAFLKTQEVSKADMDPIVAACTTEEGDKSILVLYEPYLGLGTGPFVCIITQFLNGLIHNSPEGMLAWVSTMIAALPAGVLMVAEAGRHGSYGIIRYPTLIGLLFQLIGISVAFPLFWVPGYILLGNSRNFGPVRPLRVYLGTILVFPGIILTYLLFTLKAGSYPWALCAGVLGGPILPLFSLFLWKFETTKEDDDIKYYKQISQGAVATYRAFIVVSVLSTFAWMYLMYVVIDTYGSDYLSLYADLWGGLGASGSVKFMVIDATILFLSVIIVLASKDLGDAFTALLLAPLVGPGAACGLPLWMNEVLRSKQAIKMAKKKTDDAKAK